jgi:DNA-binding GntR family transcriptional regulator
MAQLEAVQPGETLARQALPRLRSAILEGHYAPGEHLGEVPLSRQLGISRGPLREALQHLIREGLVERVPRRGVFVRSFDARALRDLSGARTAIEVQALSEAIAGAPDAAFAPLQAQLDKVAAVLNAGGAYPIALDFHRGLVRASGNAVLVEFATQAEGRLRLARAATRGDRAGARQSLAEHRAILTAVVERDLDRAEPLLRQHIARSVERLSAAQAPG